MSDFILKKITKDDVKKGAQLYYEVFTSEDWKFYWLTEEKAYNYFEDIYNTPNFYGFLFLQGEEVVGCCVGVGNPHFINKQYEIKEIFIKPTLQKQGIGNLFLEEIEMNLRNMDYQLITLYTQKTVPAFNFYKKRNYVTLKDTVHMMKIL